LRELQQRILFNQFRHAVGARPGVTLGEVVAGLVVAGGTAGITWEETNYGYGSHYAAKLWQGMLQMYQNFLGGN
jgi:hypothetical protein